MKEKCRLPDYVHVCYVAPGHGTVLVFAQTIRKSNWYTCHRSLSGTGIHQKAAYSVFKFKTRQYKLDVTPVEQGQKMDNQT